MNKFINFYRDNKKVGSIEFKNKTNDVSDIYIYGEITSGSEKYDDSDVILSEFKKNLDSITSKELNIYLNSPGGSVMTGVNILNLLKRHQSTKNVWIDALAASITSVIAMCFDNLYVYNTSTLMIHEAMQFIFGAYNKTELINTAETLQRIEDNMIIPAYMSKVNNGITEDDMKDLMKKVSWLGAKDIQKYFKNVILLEESKDIAACCKDFDILSKYNNIPEFIKNSLNINNTYSPTPSNTKDLKAQKLKVELQLL